MTGTNNIRFDPINEDEDNNPWKDIPIEEQYSHNLGSHILHSIRGWLTSEMPMWYFIIVIVAYTIVLNVVGEI